MTAGRKPKPTTLRVLDNNPGKRAINANEPKPRAATRLSPPAHLPDEAKKEWRRTVKMLQPLGLYTEIDKAALVAYCIAWSRHVEAELNLQKYGMILMGQGGVPYQSPYVAFANKAWEQMIRALAEFGMSPSSRARVTAAPGAGQKGRWSGILDDDD